MKGTHLIFKKTLLLAFTFIFSITSFLISLSPIQAETTTNEKMNTISKEEAITIATSSIVIAKEYQLINVNFNTNWGYPERSVWNLHWNLKTEGKETGSIHITIDAISKSVLSVDSYQYEEIQPLYPAKVSKEEAVIIANQFISNIYPEISETLQLDSNYIDNYYQPLGSPVYYHIPYRKLINNIPLSDPVATIQINGNGKVVNFHYYNPEPIQFEKLDSIISLEEAKKELENQLEMTLSYVFPYQNEAMNNPFIAYQPNTSNLKIDAKTGKRFVLVDEIESSQVKFSPIVDTPITPQNILAKELTQEEAIKIANSIKNELAPNTPDFQDISYDSNYGSTKHGYWNLSWYDKENPVEPTYGHMMIDAQTGELLNFYYDHWSKDTEPVISYEEAKASAINAVRKYAPSKAHEVYLKEEMNSNTEKQDRIYFTFHRVVHQIPSERETITATIDTHTGKVVAFQLNWGEVKYPETLPELITKDQAKEIYFNQLELELVYYSPYPKYDENNKEQTRTAYLVYQPISKTQAPIFMDAINGKWRDRADGNLVEKVQPKDIIGHWAEKELQLMVDYHALDLENENILPNKPITRGELIKMFIMATSNGRYIPYIEGKKESFSDVKSDSPYFGYIEEALQRQIITLSENQKFNPDQEATREELAQLITKSLGYDKLAQTKNLFMISFKDQEQFKYAGHIAIVSALKIMNGDGKYFYPTRSVTRAEAAVAFSRYLKARNQYQEINTFYPY